MDVVAGLLLVETRRLGVVVELLVNFLEVPGILELDDVENNLCFGRNAPDVGFDALGQILVFAIENKVQFINREFFLLNEADCRPPGIPTGRTAAAVCVFLSAEN